MKDLEEVVTYREALTLRPPDHPHRFTSLNNLAYAVLTRSNQLGSFKDSEEEITLGREALTLCSPGNPDRSIFLTNLANTLVNRCQRLGMEAITCYLEALTFCPPGHPDRSIFLNSLTNVDFTRHKQSGSMEDLKSDHIQPQSTHSSSSGRPDRFFLIVSFPSPILPMGILIAMTVRYHGDFKKAIENFDEALTLCPSGHQDCSTSLSNLANMLLTRHKQGSKEDLEEVIGYNMKRSLSVLLAPQIVYFLSPTLLMGFLIAISSQVHGGFRKCDQTL